MIGLKVEGDPQERPLTEGRGAEPNAKVKELHIDDLIGRLNASESYRNYLSTPEGSSAFVQRYIGPDLARQQRELGKENREDLLTTAKTSAENAKAAKYNHDAQKPFTDGDGKGGAGSSQRQRDYKFAIAEFGMSPDEAMDWASNPRSNSKEAHEYAMRMISIDTGGGREKPEGYDAATKYEAYRKSHSAAHKVGVKKGGAAGDDAGGDNPPPAGSQNTDSPPPPALRPPPKNAGAPTVPQAPKAAVDAVMKNPALKKQFHDKYGYLPSGI